MLHFRAPFVLVVALVATPLLWAEQPPTPATVGAHLVEAGDTVFRAAPPATTTRPDHPPLHLIAGVPLVDSRDGVTGLPPSTSVLVHDATTRVTTEVFPNAIEESGRRQGWSGPAGHSAPEDLGKVFSNLVQVDEPGAFPWRMNAKLVMKFRDTGGAVHYAVCSGSMIDAETVLTAAHCLYAFELQTDSGWVTVNDWAWDIWVYPGWDGEGTNNDDLPAADGRVEPYGYAHGTSFAASPGWVTSMNLDEDLGLARVDRAVGMLTGWYGAAWGGNCLWSQLQTYYNASFPAEYCGQPGMYNGLHMYSWSGAVDTCPGNQLQILVTGGCENNGWEGMSGSSLHFIDNDLRFAHAAASTRDLDDNIEFCKITDFWASYMNGTFIPMSRGTVFDLQALDANGPQAMTAGDQLPPSTVMVVNPTNASAAGTWTFRAYLSSDDVVTTADTFLGAYDFSQSFSAMQSVTVSLSPSPYLPIGTPSGYYYLGVILDPATDTVPGNNATVDWDAQRFTVFGVSDLVAQAVDAVPGTYQTGDTLSISFEVLNQGGYRSQPLTVEVRASTNAVISTIDPLLGSFDSPALNPAALLATSVAVQIPFTVTSGQRYIGIRIVSDDDHVTTNNQTSDPVPITVVATGIFADDLESGGFSAWSTSVP